MMRKTTTMTMLTTTTTDPTSTAMATWVAVGVAVWVAVALLQCLSGSGVSVWYAGLQSMRPRTSTHAPACGSASIPAMCMRHAPERLL